VIRDRTDEQRGGDGREDQAGHVEVALGVTQLGEPHGERKREQEPEQHLHAEARHAQLLDQLAHVPVVTLGHGLLPCIARRLLIFGLVLALVSAS